PPLAPTPGRLCPPRRVPGAAEAADPARAAHDPTAHCRPAAGALCHGRPALDRSDDAGIPHAPGRSRPHRAPPDAVNLLSRLQRALDRALAPHPSDPGALAPASG